jgi:hypothetical protein
VVFWHHKLIDNLLGYFGVSEGGGCFCGILEFLAGDFGLVELIEFLHYLLILLQKLSLLLFFVYVFLLQFHNNLTEFFETADVLIGTMCDNCALFHYDDVIGFLEIIDSVGGHNDCFTSEVLEDGFLHDELTNVDINCAQDVVKQVDVFVSIECPR